MTFSKTKNDKGATVLTIEGELDAVSVSDLRAVIDEIVAERTPDLSVDLGGLRLIDSSGIGALVSLHKRLRAVGGTVSFHRVRDQPLAVFRLLRLDRILTATPA